MEAPSSFPDSVSGMHVEHAFNIGYGEKFCLSLQASPLKITLFAYKALNVGCLRVARSFFRKRTAYDDFMANSQHNSEKLY